MARRKKHPTRRRITLTVPIYDRTLTVHIGNRKAAERAVLAVDPDAVLPGDEADGWHAAMPDMSHVVYLESFDGGPEATSILVHELHHVAYAILDSSGVSDFNEPLAYLLGYLTRLTRLST